MLGVAEVLHSPNARCRSIHHLDLFRHVNLISSAYEPARQRIRSGRRSGPTSGSRVLDMTTVLMGPYATLQLGDMGADIIKVEPLSCHIVRQIGLSRHLNGADVPQCELQQTEHRVDLKQPAGRDVLLRPAQMPTETTRTVWPQGGSAVRPGLRGRRRQQSRESFTPACSAMGRTAPMLARSGLRRFDPALVAR